MNAAPSGAVRAAPGVPMATWGVRPARMIERNFVAYRRAWVAFVTGFAEPILYLLSIGVGVGQLVGNVDGPGGGVSYQAFVAPGLLAVAAMNGAIFDTTFNFFIKFKYGRLYDSVLATPMRPSDVAAGEVAWALIRSGIYAAVFLLTMLALGLVESPWAVLAVPVASLVGFAFGGTGLALTTYMRSWADFDYINLALTPMFLFSATFFPLDRYPDALAWVVRLTPLYQGVALERGLILGHLDVTLVVHAAYLAAMGAVSVRIAGRRLTGLLQP